MNNIEESVILYYADYLSLRDISIPVTDNCKYYFIYDIPVNSAYILDLEPFYEVENKYYQQAFIEYNAIKDKYGEEAIRDFVDNICYLKARGTVDAKQMLKCIHHYSTRPERLNAIRKYETWHKNQKYTHTIINDDGDLVEEECNRYVAHAERKYPQKRVGYNQGFSKILGV